MSIHGACFDAGMSGKCGSEECPVLLEGGCENGIEFVESLCEEMDCEFCQDYELAESYDVPCKLKLGEEVVALILELKHTYAEFKFSNAKCIQGLNISEMKHNEVNRSLKRECETDISEDSSIEDRLRKIIEQ